MYKLTLRQVCITVGNMYGQSLIPASMRGHGMAPKSQTCDYWRERGEWMFHSVSRLFSGLPLYSLRPQVGLLGWALQETAWGRERIWCIGQRAAPCKIVLGDLAWVPPRDVLSNCLSPSCSCSACNDNILSNSASLLTTLQSLFWTLLMLSGLRVSLASHQIPGGYTEKPDEWVELFIRVEVKHVFFFDFHKSDCFYLEINFNCPETSCMTIFILFQ